MSRIENGDFSVNFKVQKGSRGHNIKIRVTELENQEYFFQITYLAHLDPLLKECYGC